jgi:hypothetical protein
MSRSFVRGTVKAYGQRMVLAATGSVRAVDNAAPGMNRRLCAALPDKFYKSSKGGTAALAEGWNLVTSLILANAGLWIKGGEMDLLLREKAKKLAKEKGRTLAWGEGYIEGEIYRRRGLQPSAYQRVGIDEYAKGFRAGFFQQALHAPMEINEASSNHS